MWEQGGNGVGKSKGRGDPARASHPNFHIGTREAHASPKTAAQKWWVAADISPYIRALIVHLLNNRHGAGAAGNELEFLLVSCGLGFASQPVISCSWPPRNLRAVLFDCSWPPKFVASGGTGW